MRIKVTPFNLPLVCLQLATSSKTNNSTPLSFFLLILMTWCDFMDSKPATWSSVALPVYCDYHRIEQYRFDAPTLLDAHHVMAVETILLRNLEYRPQSVSSRRNRISCGRMTLPYIAKGYVLGESRRREKSESFSDGKRKRARWDETAER
jgi:hypothetical protein